MQNNLQSTNSTKCIIEVDELFIQLWRHFSRI